MNAGNWSNVTERRMNANDIIKKCCHRWVYVGPNAFFRTVIFISFRLVDSFACDQMSVPDTCIVFIYTSVRWQLFHAIVCHSLCRAFENEWSRAQWIRISNLFIVFKIEYFFSPQLLNWSCLYVYVCIVYIRLGILSDEHSNQCGT